MQGATSALEPKSRLPQLLEWLGISILVAVPCLWQPHLPSTDYPSHLYNAWLGHVLETRPIPGLEVVAARTNVLADRLLTWFSNSQGLVLWEPALPLLAVLTFFWGAYFWLQRATGNSPRVLTPVLAMLSYGVIFHLGFFNHYLSTGLCLWVLGLLWTPSLRGMMWAAPLAGLALLAHPLPLLWIAAILLYLSLSRLTPGDLHGWLLIACVVMLLVARELVTSTFQSRSVWDLAGTGEILLGVVGMGQIWVFGQKYMALAALMTVFALTVVWHKIDSAPAKRTSRWDDVSLQLWILHGVALVLIPATIQLPQYRHVVSFISQRISLFGALVLCLMLADRAVGKRFFAATLAIATIYFSFLYVDSAAYNAVEAQVHALVQTVPEGERVVGPIYDEGARIPALLHVVDRACIGHCFSYGNYEPATGQFRIQAVKENPIVAWRMADVQDLETGAFEVGALQAPMHAVCACEEGGTKLCLRSVAAGQRTCSTAMQITPRWLAGR